MSDEEHTEGDWSDLDPEEMPEMTLDEETKEKRQECDHPDGHILWDRTAPMSGGAFICKLCGDVI